MKKEYGFILAWVLLLSSCSNSMPASIETKSVETSISIDTKVSVIQAEAETPSFSVSKTEDIVLTSGDGRKSVEIQVGRDSDTLSLIAVLPEEYDKNNVSLYSTDTDNAVTELSLAQSGFYEGTIQVNTDINNNDDMSEDVHYFYYVMYNDGNNSHTSSLLDVHVVEPFSDKEKADMEYVQQAITETLSTLKYSNADINKRADIVLDLLNDMADEGKIIKESICLNDDGISYQYSCGVNGGVMLKDFDDEFNGGEE